MEINKFNKIVTHANPDLDGMLCVLLLRTFGEALFPGISTSKVEFVPATELPYGMTPSQLEKMGILAVDIGGGRFDSHPKPNGGSGKIDRAAADLVAEKLGVLKDEIWNPLIEYTRMHDTSGHGLFSTDPLHHVFSLNSILEGITLKFENDSSTILEKGIQIISVIPSYVSNMNIEFKEELIIETVRKFLLLKGIDPDDINEDQEHFRQWYSQMKTNPDLTYGKHPLDRLVALRSLLHGAYYYFDKNDDLFQDFAFQVLDAIMVRENQWSDALSSYRDKAIVKKARDLKIATISSVNGMVIKAARFVDNPDILIYHNPVNGAITVFIQRRGKLNKYPFENIAARVRLTEAIGRNEKIEFENLASVGTYYGWFLHQSRNLLIRGSRKQNDFVPSCIPMPKLNEIIYLEFDNETEYDLNPKFVEAWLMFKNPIFRRK